VAAVAAGAALAGCVTTQQKNARTLLTNARTLASETPVRVTTENPSVRVLRVALITSKRDDAVVVEVRNDTPRPISDLPISVGVQRAHRGQVYLNEAANIDYYDTHVPLIPGATTLSWVLPGVRAADAAGRLFAKVGVAGTPASTASPMLPRIEAVSTSGAPSGRLRVAVANASGVPQYGLQVYAVAVRNGRYVGAARGALGELDGGSRMVIALPLVGSAVGASVALYAPPTIFK
jgi:hypothetical protein